MGRNQHRPEMHKRASWKQPVRVATTAAGTLATSFENGDTIDGKTLATGDRILLKDQGTGTENGIYIVAASGAPARAFDMDDASEVVGALVYVVDGTANGGKVFRNTNLTTPTLGATDITFDELTAGTAVLALDDLTDVVVSAPDDADVLTYDGGSGLWYPMPPSAGSLALDDLTDVNAPSPADQDVLTWDDGAGEWVAAAAPGGDDGGRPYLDTYSDPLDGTMGDDFDESSLNARWTRRTITSGWETYQVGGGSWLQCTIGSATAACQYEQTAPAGDWEFIASFLVTRSHSAAFMYGLMCKDSSGNGRGACFYSDYNCYVGTIASHAYSTFTSSLQLGHGIPYGAGEKVWARLRKSGNTIYCSWSNNGTFWTPELSVSDSSTWATIALGRVYGASSSGEDFYIDRFDRVA